MSDVKLSDQFFQKTAGWEAVKQARSLVERGNVLSSNWTPPLLKGVVQEGGASYRAGLVIKGETDVENICSCRQSREWGTICAHSVGVGIHHLKKLAEPLANAAEQGGRVGGGQGKPGANAVPVNPAPRLKRRDGGEPAELFFILPPNLGAALERGRVMLCVEAKWARGRGPINGLPLEKVWDFSDEDLSPLEVLEGITRGEPPGMIQLTAAELAKVLDRLKKHPRVAIGRNTELEVSEEPYRLKVKATLEADGQIVVGRASLPGQVAFVGASSGVSEGNLPGRDARPTGASWIFAANRFQPMALPNTVADILAKPVVVSRGRVPLFLIQEWSALAAGCEVEANFQPQDFQFDPQPPKFLLHLAGGLAQLSAQLQCAYGPRIMTLGVSDPNESLWVADPDNAKRYSTRDLAAEQAALTRLTKYGFRPGKAAGTYELAGQNQVLTFLAREHPKLEKEWKVTLEERLEFSANKNLERIEPKFQITPSGVQWFDLDVSFGTKAGETFSQADIQRLLLGGQSHTRLKNGKFALIDTGAVEELQEVLLDCNPQQTGAGYRMNATQAGFLDSTLSENGWQASAPTAWKERAKTLAGEVVLACPPLGKLEDVLRPYQKHGVGWMHFLRNNGFGGILADEMGLGKTLQALAFLSAVGRASLPGKSVSENRSVLKSENAHLPGRDARPAGGRPHLVVCPTSLVFNWAAEAAKFTPELKVVTLQGPDRHKRFAEIADADLVVTSYALVRRDAERYRAIEFDTVVLDEAQHIKNRQTQNAQAVKAIRSQHRLVLTGTPLENSVLDLWSIFDFLMPGYLGTAQDFRDRYEQPITKTRDADAQARLARRLKPFLLRRLKREVAKELPDKLEQISFCDLSDEQAQVYKQVLDATRREVVMAVDQNGLAKSRMVVLSALLRLRQICCDLRLLKLEEPVGPTSMPGESVSENRNVPKLEDAQLPGRDARPATPAPSGKLEMFSELLEEVVDGEHRVLVFSQFVGMLTLLRERLEADGIEYCYLDGSTKDRGEAVRGFQTGKAPVFLISLKAGGVGLNLTGADTVIHFDPWWNPAVEDQATDRAHRIGQTRVVTSYKLITRGTIEEKIVQLQKKKRDIIAATLTGEEALTGSLNWAEIQDLLG
jgi:superfamily II DNA or RNA helicase